MTRPQDAPDARAIQHGSRIGKFVVVAELGSGGMGVVYAAHDRELDRQVALKVMRGAGEDADEDRVRMLREGQAMARVVHPNVITVFEVGTEGGMVFLAQELLDGGTLGQWLEKPHSHAEIVDKFVAAGRGLAAAHAVGLVHRDFKPDNVLLGKDGRVRVADFGLARTIGAYADPKMMATAPGGGPTRTDIDVTKSPMAHNLTRTGAVMGTPMFMAPEQHEGRRADERSDQFAFCVALWYALHGDWPYEGKTSIALADNVINGVMKPPPKTSKVSPRRRKILLRGLSKDAADRYPSMEALLSELVIPEVKSGKKIGFAIAAIVLVGGGAATAFMLLQGRAEKPAVVVEDTPKPVVAQDTFDPSLLVRAVDQGTLDMAETVFRNDAGSMSQSSAAVMLALRGDLPGAEAKLKAAEAVKGTDAKSAAYVDMAASAIAYARGELPTAAERSARCASALSGSDAIGSAMCLQIQGDTAAEMDNTRLARDAYNSGSVIAQNLKDKQIESMFQLSVAQLDFDEKHEDVSLDAVNKLRKEARSRRAASCEAGAAVLASRILLRKADQQAALDQVDDLDPKILQAFRLQAIARIAVGEVYGYKNEADEDGVMGLDRIADVQDEAQKKELWGVVLEAKLARVRVRLTLAVDGAEADRKALITEANTRGYKRIARLAQTYIAESPPAPQ
ncbi:MAG: serine/threonine protein kinase [Myxococcota bacterium]|nr:serine/threonine protein kinase [Myxococcota bacterium]